MGCKKSPAIGSRLIRGFCSAWVARGRTLKASHHIAQGNRSGVAAKRHPGFGFNDPFQPCKGCTNGCGTLSGFTILPQPPTQGGAALALGYGIQPLRGWGKVSVLGTKTAALSAPLSLDLAVRHERAEPSDAHFADTPYSREHRNEKNAINDQSPSKNIRLVGMKLHAVVIAHHKRGKWPAVPKHCVCYGIQLGRRSLAPFPFPLSCP